MDKYFELLQHILNWQSKRHYGKMLECCARSLPLLPALIAGHKREYGRFDISSIPAIEVGCRYWAAMNDTEALQSVEKSIRTVPELLEGWASVVRAAFDDERLSSRIQEYVKEHPGTPQNKLGKALGASGRDAARIVGTLVNIGRINRLRSGNTYNLSSA